MSFESVIWLGNKASFDAVADLKAKQHEFKDEFKADYMRDGMENPADKPEHPLLDVQANGVGIVNVSGPLVAGSAGFMRFFGITGYEDVANAFLAGLQNPDVQSFVMLVNSPGGDVAGCHETAMFIDQISKIKPVVTYASGLMASAGLWLGATGSYSMCSATTIVGSLGVMRVHRDVSKAMENDGIKVTIIRAGDKKNLVNPFEPLTGEALAVAEDQASAIHEVFTAWVADHRGVSVKVANTNFAQGQEFVGKWAVDAGLIDAIGTLEQAVAKSYGLQKSKGGRKSSGMRPQIISNSVRVEASSSNNTAVSGAGDTTANQLPDNDDQKQGNPMPKPYTQEQLAAMAAGVILEETPEASASTGSAGAAPDETGNTASTEASAVTDPKDAEISSLKALLATADEKIAATEAEVVTLKATVASTEWPLASVSEIVRNSIKAMLIPLNADTKALAAMDAAALVTEHARVSALFKDTFKVGAAASMAPAEPEEKQKSRIPAVLDPRVSRMAMSVPRA